MVKKVLFMFLLMLSLPLCATAASVSLPKTGETLCYNDSGTIPCPGTGQDGEKQIGAAWPTTRFTINLTAGSVPDGTITDTLTGLTWLTDSKCAALHSTTGNPSGGSTWATALTKANGLASGACGLLDGSTAGQWRLPNVNELESLIDISQNPPFPAGNPFTITHIYDAAPAVPEYWTSTIEAVFPSNAESVNITTGDVRGALQTTLKNVWPVRGTSTNIAQTGQTSCPDPAGTTPPFPTITCPAGSDGLLQKGVAWPTPPRFVDNLDGTLTDNLTGLIWLQRADCFSVVNTQAVALTSANGLASPSCALTDGSLPGDWRLPNRNEMRSLISYGQYSGAAWLLSSGFINPQGGWYWSSDSYPVVPATSNKWMIKSEGGTWLSGTVATDAPTDLELMLPVRGPLKIQPITFTSATKTVGDPALDLTTLITRKGASASPVTFAVMSGPGTLNGTMLSLDAPGSIVVKASQAGDGTTFLPATDTLQTITVNPKTFTVAFVSGGNGTLTGTASQSVANGASASAVTAVASTGFHFVQWTGTGGFTSTDNPLTLTNVTADQTLTAIFAATSFTVTFASGGNGTLTGTTSQIVNSGASTSAVTAVPASGFQFVQWTGAGGFTSTDNPLTLANVTADQTLTASFAATSFAVTFASGGNGSLTGTASQTVNSGASTSAVTAVPDAGYHFVQWTGTGGFTRSDNPLTLTNVTAAQTITANFAVTTFTVNFAAGSNGTLTGTASQTVNSGASASAVTAVPATGYHFVQWTGTGGFTSTSNPLTFANVTADQTLTASFAVTTFTVTFTAGSNGSLTGTASQTVNSGAATSAVSAVPATGYHFVQWTGPGSSTSTSNPITVSNVTASQTLTASFAINTFQVTGSVTGGNGTISCTPTTVNSGSNAVCTVTPTAGYHLITLTDNSADKFSTVSGTTYTISNVTANHALVTTFARPTGIINSASGKTGPDISDVLAVLKMVLNKTATALDVAHADIAPLGADGKPLGDGKLDIYDVIGILRMSIGL